MGSKNPGKHPTAPPTLHNTPCGKPRPPPPRGGAGGGGAPGGGGARPGGGGGRGGGGRRPRGRLGLAQHQPGHPAQGAADDPEHQVRHARHQAEREHNARSDAQRARRVEHLAANLGTDVLVLAHARNHHRRRHRDQQRRNLRHQRVTHGQRDVAASGFAGAHVVAGHADDEAADDGDEQDQQASHRVAANELAGTVHRPEEVGLFTHLGTPLARLVLVDQAGVEIGVDRHLLARHRVQREARADLGNALGTLGDDDEVDDDQDRKHDQADREVVADQHVAEGLDHLAGGARAVVAAHQHHARRCHVQRQAHQRGHQQHRRQRREVQRLDHLRRHHHHHQRHRDVQREQQVQRQRRQRQHHHRQHQHDEGRHRQRLHTAGLLARQRLQSQQQRLHASTLRRRAARGCTRPLCGSSSGGTCGVGAGMAAFSRTSLRSW